MSCDDVRQALPLLPGTDVEHSARIRAHAVSCETCGELLRTFEADDRLLAAAARLDRRAPAVMDGFTASVMARIADEQRIRRVTPAPAAAPPPTGGVVLRPVFFRALAAAAAVLVAVGIGLSSRPGTEQPVQAVLTDEQPVRTTEFAVAPTSDDPLPMVDVTSDPLPAPRLERDPAPMPQRRRGGPVVPVDQGSSGRRNVGQARGVAPGQQGDLFEYLEKVLPNLHQRMMKELGEEQGREVRF